MLHCVCVCAPVSVPVCVCVYLTGPQRVLAEPCHLLPRWGEMPFHCSLPFSSMLLRLHQHPRAQDSRQRILKLQSKKKKLQCERRWCVPVHMSGFRLLCVWVQQGKSAWHFFLFTSKLYPRAKTWLWASFFCPKRPSHGCVPPAAPTGFEMPLSPLLCVCVAVCFAAGTAEDCQTREQPLLHLESSHHLLFLLKWSCCSVFFLTLPPVYSLPICSDILSPISALPQPTAH